LLPGGGRAAPKHKLQTMEKVSLFGFKFWNASGVEEVIHALTDRQGPSLFANDNIQFIITPNAHDIVQYVRRYPSIRRSLQQAAVVLPDGIPIVWLSKFYRPSLEKRITGSSLFPALWRRIKQDHSKAFFILPNQAMAEQLYAEYPFIRYAIPGIFEAKDDEYVKKFIRQHIGDIRAYRPDFIFIGITIPKQQKMALELHHWLSGAVDFNCFVAILGASFEFYLGSKKRAPVFFQKTGLEWLYRFAQEPGRMWKRYTLGNLLFLAIAIKQLFTKRGPE
jgi:N-acetylglucosaminyldiphosphoundecaprenol N-acetyl-beta-D-mannosaminyltransferase